MTPERFEELAWASGGDTASWPAVEQPAAQVFAERSPLAADILAEAGTLDVALDAWRTPAPDGALLRRIAATAGPARASWRRAMIWWSGLAVAATAAAGALTGAFVLAGPAMQAAPAPAAPAEMAYEPTAFGDLDQES